MAEESKKETQKGLCKGCIHWKNEQAELGYGQFVGICTCPAWEWTPTNYSGVAVLDREKPGNIKKAPFEYQKSSIPIGEASRSRYCLITETHFGCIHFHSSPK